VTTTVFEAVENAQQAGEVQGSGWPRGSAPIGSYDVLITGQAEGIASGVMQTTVSQNQSEQR